nr:hypothetical protein [Saccharothrix carnea]
MTDDDEPVHTRAAMTENRVEHAVIVTPDGGPLGVLSMADLRRLGDVTTSFAALADRMPALVVLAAEPDALATAELLDLAELVGRTGIQSVLLEAGGRPVGVVPRAALAAAVPLDLLDGRGVRAGDPNVPALRYVCRRCTPPSFLLLRTPLPDERRPTCRRIFFHGTMEPDS